MNREQYIDVYFESLFENVSLTDAQETDARTKYNSVIKKLTQKYYESDSIDNRFQLFGSYGKRTHLRPARDVDVQFILPYSQLERVNNWQGNKQSRFLQEIKDCLLERFPRTTIRSDEKVVVVNFADSTHDVEVLPSFKISDTFYYIPDTKKGGNWCPVPRKAPHLEPGLSRVW